MLASAVAFDVWSEAHVWITSGITCLESWWDFVPFLGVIFWGDLSVVTSKSRGVCEYHHSHKNACNRMNLSHGIMLWLKFGCLLGTYFFVLLERKQWQSSRVANELVRGW